MATDQILIEEPVLDTRTEAERISDRIHRTIGNLTPEAAQLAVTFFELLKKKLESSGPVSAPLTPELTSARPGEPHVVLLTEIERAITETIFRLNQVPNKNRIAFLRLLGVVQLSAQPSTTTLQFTKLEDYLNVEVVIPVGSLIATTDLETQVTIDEELTIPAGEMSGTVSARAVIEGDIRLPANTIGLLLEAIAGVESVTNTTPLIGGAAAESVDQAKIRAREEMQAGKHLTSAADWENYIFFNTLRRNGRCVAFENYIGNFTRVTDRNGYLLLSIQGADGLQPSDDLIEQVAAVVSLYRVTGISIAVRSPIYKAFSIEAQVRITQGQSATTLINKAKQNLQNFFHPLTFAFGPTYSDRRISVSDIIGQIENAAPNGISVRQNDGTFFEVKIIADGGPYSGDVPLGIGEVPSLQSVTLTPVN